MDLRALALLVGLLPVAVIGAEPPPADGLRDRVVGAALEQLGAPYRYGGSGPEAFDCSGLVQWSYGNAGVRLPRSTVDQRHAGPSVPLTQADPGDLLFFGYPGEVGKPSGLHVAIYLGGHRAVHAPSSGGRVEIIDTDAPHWRDRFIQAVRVVADAPRVASAAESLASPD